MQSSVSLLLLLTLAFNAASFNNQELVDLYNKGIEKKDAYLLIATDYLDPDSIIDFEIFVPPSTDVQKEITRHTAPGMERVLNVYKLDKKIIDYEELKNKDVLDSLNTSGKQ